LTYVNVPVVAADHTVGLTSPIDAFTSIEQTAAFANTSEAANVKVLPDNDIREEQGPVGVTVIW
jgi:hypothetical protein